VRRAIVALVGTAAGTVLLVGAKAGVGFGTDPVPLANHPGTAGSGSPGVAPATSAGPSRGAAAPGASAGPGGPGAAPTTTTAPAPAAPTKRPPNGKMRDGTWNGAPAYTEFGNVELAIVVSGGKITDVKVLDYPQEHSRSSQINNRALPRLRQEVLAAQSASIDSVSGATYTSDGYRESLQSAIDAAFGA
jgi:uncharacterized protein with FMN-binding domain